MGNHNRTKLVCAAAILLAVGNSAYAADHLDAPAVVNDPASDINDVYTFINPNDSGELILVMTVNPIANDATRFSDAVQYEFQISNDDSTRQISCSFSRPDDMFLNQNVTCTAPGDRTVSGALNTVNQSGDLRVFAGLRDDPFFFDLAAFNTTVADAAPAFTNPGVDFFAGLNTLSIVVGIDSSVFAPAVNGSNNLSIWATTNRINGGGINAGITGTWYGVEEDQNGHGFQIEVLERPQNGPYDNDVLVIWYNYVDGQQIFMLGEGRAEGGQVVIPLEITSGADFGINFNSDDVVFDTAGVLTLDMDNCDFGRADFTAENMDLSDFALDIQRLTAVKNQGCNFFQEGQIDRMGRPAVNTALIGADRKDIYNMATDPATWAASFQTEMAAALDFVDGLEGMTGNALLGDSTALAGVLVDDRLVVAVDVSACDQYLAVELGDTANCGGRTLSMDVMDTTLDALVAFGAGVGDGVDSNDREFLGDFPFLATPN